MCKNRKVHTAECFLFHKPSALVLVLSLFFFHGMGHAWSAENTREKTGLEIVQEYNAAILEGKRMFEGKNYDGAVIAFKKALALPGYGQDEAVKKLLAEAQAKAQANKTIQAFAENMAHGKGLLEKGDPQGAIDLVERALALDGYAENEDAVQLLAEAEFAKGDYYFNGMGGIKRDYIKALEYYNLAANKGIAAAQNNVGYMYDCGLGVPVDFVKARKEYEKAYQKGYPEAAYNLGWIYLNGQGVDKDEIKANMFFNEATKRGILAVTLFKAEKGFSREQCVLGSIYVSGKGDIKADMAKAMEWYTKSAEQGYDVAEAGLGSLFYGGKDGITKDLRKAFEWYNKSAARNNASAMFFVGRMYLAGEGVDKNPVKAAEYLSKSAALNFPYAQLDLALMYNSGMGGFAENPKMTFDLLKKASIIDDPVIQLYMGDCHINGYGIEQDYDLARQWYIKSANKNNLDALYSLGVLIAERSEKHKDVPLAITYLQRSADQGHVDAMVKIGELYYLGDTNFPRNAIQAEKWLKKATEQGNHETPFLLAAIYLIGDGVAQNIGEAKRLFEKASNAGLTEAKEALKQINQYSQRELTEIVREPFFQQMFKQMIRDMQK